MGANMCDSYARHQAVAEGSVSADTLSSKGDFPQGEKQRRKAKGMNARGKVDVGMHGLPGARRALVLWADKGLFGKQQTYVTHQRFLRAGLRQEGMRQERPREEG